ncbi:hypothetical protein AB0J85_12905 [Micromonospora echinofusca]|uniref:hypothetical protein n=1 Tax=Micromonospora echinofusca TaxID=47858 RepID=UPI00342740FA
MKGQVGAEAEPRPPRSRWVGRGRLAVRIVPAVAVLALGGAWWFSAVGEEPTVRGPEAGPVRTADTPNVERPSTPQEATQQSGTPLPPIPGTTVDAVAADWAKLWKTPLQPSTRGYDTTAALPGTGYRTRFVALRSPAGDGTELATLFCLTRDQRLVRDRRLVRAVVDSCLAPALRDGEKSTLSTWLTEQDYSRDVYATRELPRFVVELVSRDDAFQVKLASKGRTAGPGAVPAASTSATG